MKITMKLSLIITSCMGITLYSSEHRFTSDEVRKNANSANQTTRNYDQELAQITAQAYITTGRKVPLTTIMDLDPTRAAAATQHNQQLQSQLQTQQRK